MSIDRTMSEKTREKIDECVQKIKCRAVESKDDIIWGLADTITQLLVNLDLEIDMEDSRTVPHPG